MSYQEVWLFSQHNNSSKGSCNSVWSWRCATSRLEICTSENNWPHYDNTGVLVYLAGVSLAFNLQLAEYNNFEAGEGKSVLNTHFAHEMKNVKCLKLVIDRTKAPKKVGSLKDISQFGSFRFPLSGKYSGGLVCRSLVGLGKTSSKTQAQMKNFSSVPFPIAGETGAKTEDMDLHAVSMPEENDGQSVQSDSETYSVKFIQHADQQTILVQPNLVVPSDAALAQQPEPGFALKQTSGKIVLFSLEQKQIMIAYYDRQASTGMRAETQDVINEM
ncbi:hypothetical protein OS493_009037 [Desmophyllum pertusum]|uniref:Uncharacterized protein n=1 Tax=Desmophyllum pertusum TaxID=174260 RepID=A0A9W9ZFM8_9CNID|nr:hypothetical protein OS493_009037 [Desmophyllum pertusum]